MVKRSITYLLENSLLLILGAVAALVWANLDHASYEYLLHIKLLTNDWIGYSENGKHILDLHYLVNDILMAFFFAIAGKEVWEAILPGGVLNDPRRATVPVASAVGGMVAPALVYLLGTVAIGQFSQLSQGWAIPCATDIAFSYMIARFIFGDGHAAIPFLLLLAIVDDALGLIILAVFYPQGETQPLWLALPVLAIGVGFVLRRLRLHSFWWYLALPGALSWFGFAQAGLHPALGLLPIIPTLPHAHVDKGLFNWEEMNSHDTLNEFEHWWEHPVELILGLFSLLNAGVVVNAAGAPTYLILAGLLLGKPLGIWLCGMFAARVLGMGLPTGIESRDLVVVGFAAGIGFTVALFIATVAFKDGPIQDAAKMGALASFVGVLLAFLSARLLGVNKVSAQD